MNINVTIQQKDPPGLGIICQLGDGIQKMKADGGWTVVHRPKWVGFTNWDGFSPLETTLPLMLDGFASNQPVGLQFAAIMLMQRPASTPRDHAPIIAFSGPGLMFTHLRWVIQSIDVSDQILRPADGAMMRVAFDLQLLQYVPANVVISEQRTTPAAAARDRQQTAVSTSTSTSTAPGAGSALPSSGTYTVRSGDTLSKIAASQLGDASRYREIADLNGIRDPNNISVGQVLRMPGSTAAPRIPDPGLTRSGIN